MKVDGLGVILAIILLPIILVVSYYIELQVNTISMQNTYNSNLLAATHDAMAAFEANTANENYSSAADSMRSIVLASNNVLLDSLASNMGITNASKENLQPYIPAVLYTMYDGYYIYAPTETPKVVEKKKEENGLITTDGYMFYGGTDENGDEIKDIDIEGTDKAVYGDILYELESSAGSQKYTINKDKAKKETNYVLKSYVQYSARYARDNIDVTINYTLDNYLNIVGKIGDVYYTKTGYLIAKNLVTLPDELKNLNEDDAKEKILGKKTNAADTTIQAENSPRVTVDGIDIKAVWDDSTNGRGIIPAFKKIDEVNAGETKYQEISTISEAEENLKKAYEDYENLDPNDSNRPIMLTAIQELEYQIGNYNAIAYYVSSAIFSNWVYTNLEDLTYRDIKDNVMTEYFKDGYQTSSGTKSDLYYNFSGNGTKIFDEADPEKPESNFNVHKMEVIKNSIKYNLNLAMSAYTKMEHPYDCSLPILLDEEWDKILSNISIVSFMQGFDCGLKIYNNYEIVSSTNNELMVTPSEIYYVKKDEFNKGEGNYHRIDCPYLEENNDADEYISFKSKEVKYDKIYDSNYGGYRYDHKNLSCYTCINTNNYYERSLFRNLNGSYYERMASLWKKEPNDRSSNPDSVAKKRAGYIGIAKERQNTYKTNALPVSEGYTVLSNSLWNTSNGRIESISLNLAEITELRITIAVDVANTKPNGNSSKLQVLKLNISDNSTESTDKDILLTQSSAQTIVVDVSNWSGNSIKIVPKDSLPAGYTVSYKVESIKAIHK